MSIDSAAERGPIGHGAKRAIAFGGGGEWFVSWMLGYALALRDAGVDLGLADVGVGTSAGSVAGSAIVGGHLWGLPHKVDQLGSHPALANRILSIEHGAPSQVRANDVVAATTTTDVDALREIGRAAMAAHNAPAEAYVKSVGRMVGRIKWPAGFHVTATDCYTGEPVLIGPDDGIEMGRACAASTSLPGTSGPVWVDDRLCMDGGCSDSSTHARLLEGAEVVLILAMLDFEADPPPQFTGSFGMSERIAPGTARREADYLRERGSKVHVAVAAPDLSLDFMDAAQIHPAIQAGHDRGTADAPVLAELWSSVGSSNAA